LAIALQALAGGEIRLGARKRRGFGCCRVAGWKVTAHDLHAPEGLLAWLKTGFPAARDAERNPDGQLSPGIASLLGVSLTEADLTDRREWFEIEADFQIDGSLIVRGGFDEQDRGPDVVHLLTKRGRDKKPVLPGTSVAGAIRHRALRIANTLAGKKFEAGVQNFIGNLFGPEMDSPGNKELRKQNADKSGEKKAEPRASRVVINEELIRGGEPLVQTRIKIDRFTGGTIEGALLEEAPHFGGGVKMQLRLRNPADAEVGLLLLVLKDLWLGDLPLGGESSIGRGRLRGVKAMLRHSRHGEIEMSGEARGGDIALTGENAAARLEAYVSALQRVDWENVEND
jgi:CRISPR/Cas system CSM-associated protein Csm3 (group 7 of RAMP superfamily)